MKLRGTYAAVILLSLLMMSFVQENKVLIEGDITEFLDKSEKDKDKDLKEKKLFFSGDLQMSPYLCSTYCPGLLSGLKVVIKGILQEVLTPPPELA